MKTKSYVCFSVKNKYFAIESIKVLEIKDYRDIKVNETQGPPFLIGLTYFVNNIVPILDLQHLLYNEVTSLLQINSTLFIQTPSQIVAVLITGLPNIIEFDENNISQDNSSFEGNSNYIEAVAKEHTEIFYILDIDFFNRGIHESQSDIAEQNPHEQHE